MTQPKSKADLKKSKIEKLIESNCIEQLSKGDFIIRPIRKGDKTYRVKQQFSWSPLVCSCYKKKCIHIAAVERVMASIKNYNQTTFNFK